MPVWEDGFDPFKVHERYVEPPKVDPAEEEKEYGPIDMGEDIWKEGDKNYGFKGRFNHDGDEIELAPEDKHLRDHLDEEIPPQKKADFSNSDKFAQRLRNQ